MREYWLDLYKIVPYYLINAKASIGKAQTIS